MSSEPTTSALSNETPAPVSSSIATAAPSTEAPTTPTLPSADGSAKKLHPLKEASLPTMTSPPNQEIRVGVIKSLKPTPKALQPAYFLTVDFGPGIGIKHSSTQISQAYPDMDSLVGQKVCCVVNVERLRLGRLYSECLTLGVHDDSGELTCLIQPDPRARIGARVF